MGEGGASSSVTVGLRELSTPRRELEVIDDMRRRKRDFLDCLFSSLFSSTLSRGLEGKSPVDLDPLSVLDFELPDKRLAVESERGNIEANELRRDPVPDDTDRLRLSDFGAVDV